MPRKQARPGAVKTKKSAKVEPVAFSSLLDSTDSDGSVSSDEGNAGTVKAKPASKSRAASVPARKPAKSGRRVKQPAVTEDEDVVATPQELNSDRAESSADESPEPVAVKKPKRKELAPAAANQMNRSAPVRRLKRGKTQRDPVPEPQYEAEAEDDEGPVRREQEVVTAKDESYSTLKAHYDALQCRFAQLSELRETKAEALLYSYRENAEKRFQAADALIADLRDELARQAQALAEMQTRASNTDRIEEQAEQMESAIDQLRRENSVLKSKLLARSATSAGTSRLREQLFEDLSGLIIRDVRSEDDKVVYDCLQTGRNGAFHYKLLIPNCAEASTDESTAVTFIPLLDENRDQLLMSLLPDYLLEPLEFSRDKAVQFNWKIMLALQQQPANE